MPDVILPVLNEVDAIPRVLAGMPAEFHPIVVDNASDDGSADVAAELGAQVVFEPRRGFGAACWAGLRAATDDIVCFMDCDGSLRAEDLTHVATPVRAGRADLVLGARDARPGSWPLHARVSNRLLAWELRRRTGVRLQDLGPMRAARRAEVLALGIEDRRFGWPLEMVLRAADARWLIREVDVRYEPRIGRSKVTGTLQGTARAVYDMARVLR